MKRIWFTVISSIIIITYPLQAQVIRKKGNLPLLEMKHKAIIPILEEMVTFEQQCDYYSPELAFSIRLTPLTKGAFHVQLESIGQYFRQSGNELGCFEYKGHIFLVEGKRLCTDIFKVTLQQKAVIYTIFKDGIDPETGKAYHFLIEEDDSYSIWDYYYIDKTFIRNGFYTHCGSKNK